MAVNPMMDGARGATDLRSAGVNGINAGMNGMAHAAQEVAELNVREPSGGAADSKGSGRLSDSADALTDLRIYQRQVQASAVVVKTADAVVGFLLDVHA
jgi:methyl-accepting chemotaxis protein